MHAATKMFHALKCLKQSFTYNDDDDGDDDGDDDDDDDDDDVGFSIKIIHMSEM